MLSWSFTSSLVTRTPSSPVRSVSFSGERMVATTFQPLARKVFAASLPKPVEQPVMSTVGSVIYLDLRSWGLVAVSRTSC